MSNDDCLSESATKDLVKLLVKRGHFHQNVVPELAHHDKKKSDPCPYSDTDVSCQLVATLDDQLVMTKEQMQVKLMQELSAVGGRMSVEDAATALAVDPAHIEHISSDETIMRVGDHLITEQYFDAMAEATNLQLVKHDGHVVVSDLAANVWNLPMELTLSALEKRIESKMINAKLLTLSGMKVLVTPFYEERERCRIRGAFRAITLPTNVSHDEYLLSVSLCLQCLRLSSPCRLTLSVMSFIGIVTMWCQSCRDYVVTVKSWAKCM